MDKFQQHVANKCANYDKSGKCLLETSEDGCRDCPLFSEANKRCVYYELALLPERPKLEREYWEARGVVYEDLTVCERCNGLYRKKSNAQKYCADCAETKRKQRRREQNSRQYQKRKEMHS